MVARGLLLACLPAVLPACSLDWSTPARDGDVDPTHDADVDPADDGDGAGPEGEVPEDGADGSDTCGTVESCNGVDDDCDTVCDEGFPCCDGRVEPCTTGTGAPGTSTCGAGCVTGACVATSDPCNGLDDDGNTVCDDGFACCKGTTASRACGCGGTESQTCETTCLWGAWSGCAPGACVPDAEESCTTGCGSTGTRTCRPDCTWDVCVPPAEICNGIDDDCVAGCDNGYECCGDWRAETRPCACGGVESRRCGGGCNWSGWSGCTGTCTPGATRSCGGCSGAVETCTPDGCGWGSCATPAETCNGVDDDCDTTCDEGFACCRGDTQARTCTSGSCPDEDRTCDSSCAWGSWSGCFSC